MIWFVVRIGCDRVYRARITRRRGRVAVLRRDKNRLVPLECLRVDDPEYLVTSDDKWHMEQCGMLCCKKG